MPAACAGEDGEEGEADQTRSGKKRPKSTAKPGRRKSQGLGSAR